MLEKIVEGRKKALDALERIRKIPPEQVTEKQVYAALKEAVNNKLMLPETGEDNLRRLVIMSIKRQSLAGKGLPEEVLYRQIQKYDCHQTSLAAQKKVLLQMFLEKELGICLSQEEAEAADDLKDMAKIYTRHLRGGTGSERENAKRFSDDS